MTPEHEAARAVLEALGVDLSDACSGEEYRCEPSVAVDADNIAILIAFARRAKAEALREAADAISETPCESWPVNLGMTRAVEILGDLAAKLEETQ